MVWSCESQRVWSCKSQCGMVLWILQCSGPVRNLQCQGLRDLHIFQKCVNPRFLSVAYYTKKPSVSMDENSHRPFTRNNDCVGVGGTYEMNLEQSPSDESERDSPRRWTARNLSTNNVEIFQHAGVHLACCDWGSHGEQSNITLIWYKH